MIVGTTQNKVIAITGGIGSGKSTALKIVEKLGYKSFNADLIYKELLLDEGFTVAVSSLMGTKLIIENGKKTLDRKAISQIVFSDKSKLKTLNGFTHPQIMKRMLEKAKSEKGLVFCEVPLLYEGGFESLFDCVFIIKRKDEKRFESASIRDGKSIESIKEVAKNQFDYTKITLNEHTFIIDNDGDVENLTENVKFALEKIKI